MKKKLKLIYGESVKIYYVDHNTSFGKFKSTIEKEYKFKLSFKYQDYDKQLIDLNSDLDFSSMLHSTLSTIIVHLSKIILKNKKSIKNNGLPDIRNGVLQHIPSNRKIDVKNPNHKTDLFALDNEQLLNFRKGELIGKGASGCVYQGLLFNGQIVAVKEVFIEMTESTVHNLINEINILRAINHPNIIKYLGASYLHPKVFIFLEYASGGSLANILQIYGILNESIIQRYVYEIVKGLDYLHQLKINHGDIKSHNLLVDGCIKLSDFGSSKFLYGHQQNTKKNDSSPDLNITGTLNWIAPEVLTNCCTNDGWFKADIWSLGCTIVELSTAEKPWGGKLSDIQLLYKIANTKDIPLCNQIYGEILQDFVSKCLQRDPKERWTVKQLLCHRFLNGQITSTNNMPSILSFDSNQITGLSSFSSNIRKKQDSQNIIDLSPVVTDNSCEFSTSDDGELTNNSNRQMNAIRPLSINNEMCMDELNPSHEIIRPVVFRNSNIPINISNNHISNKQCTSTDRSKTPSNPRKSLANRRTNSNILFGANTNVNTMETFTNTSVNQSDSKLPNIRTDINQIRHSENTPCYTERYQDRIPDRIKRPIPDLYINSNSSISSLDDKSSKQRDLRNINFMHISRQGKRINTPNPNFHQPSINTPQTHNTRVMNSGYTNISNNIHQQTMKSSSLNGLPKLQITGISYINK